jgi:Fungal specific transcription factor domain
VDTAGKPKHVDPVRFVGDLNPESFLVADLSERPVGSARQSRIGVWIEGSGDEAQNPSGNANSHDHTLHASSSSKPRALTAAARHPSLLCFLQDTGAFTVLPAATQKSLIELYVSHVHPFLPLVDIGSFLPGFERGEASNFLVLAICLTASRSSDAAPFLRWDADGPVVLARGFAKRLYDGLHFAINAGQVTDPLVNIQVLGLLALHNDGPRGLENASMHLCQAIHHAHTLGLHIDSSRSTARNGHTERLFWSLWCLDKFQACMAGRPVKMFDQDIGLARPTPSDEHSQALFQQHIALCDLLADIIYYYRPTTDQNSTGWEEGFPTIEEIMSDSKGLRITESSKCIVASYDLRPTDSQAVNVELLYHIAAIIACRAGTVGTRSYDRREAAAHQIELITSNPSVHKSPLPIAPYAVSLSMTVAYRKLRDDQSTVSSPAHVRNLAHRCEILETFSERWWSAEAMARLGRKALQNIQELSKTRCHDQELAKTSERPSHDSDVLNPLEMLSSVAESHAQGCLSNEISQTIAASTDSGDIITADEPLLEIQDRTTFGPAAADTNEQFDTFRDLDTAFEEFFDLSMPTTFFDPLFEEMGMFDFTEVPD